MHKYGATGAILRDHMGGFIAAANKFLPHVASAKMAEAMAMREGLSLAIRIGCNVVVVESDSIETIQACSGGDMWWTELAAIYADCVDLANSIGNINFLHCRREANGVAHELAKFSFINKSLCIWDDDPLGF